MTRKNTLFDFTTCHFVNVLNGKEPCFIVSTISQSLNLSQGMSWENVPLAYRTCPFFIFDEEVIVVKQDYVDKEEEEEGAEICDNEIVFHEIPQKIYAKRSKASACREILHQIRSMTFLVSDMDALDVLEE